MWYMAFFCILDFPGGGGGEDPRTPPPDPIKGMHRLNPPQIFLQQQQQSKAEKEPEYSPPIKTIYQKFIFRKYRN